MRFLSLAVLALASGATFALAPDVADAADATLPVKAAPAPVAQGYTYAGIVGSHVADGEGSGILNGFDPRRAYPGSGFWVSGYVGKVTPTMWDWRIGAGFAKLRAGASNGAGDPDEFGIGSARMFNVDADVGPIIPVGSAAVRPFVGMRYLNWVQKQEFRPDVPLGCCFMDSHFWGIGPRVGIDAKLPIARNVTVLAGADASFLFGQIEFDRGFASVPVSGDQHRNALAYGGYAAVELAIAANVGIAVGYRALSLRGTSYDNQRLFNPAGPSGKGTNLLHGPGVALNVKL